MKNTIQSRAPSKNRHHKYLEYLIENNFFVKEQRQESIDNTLQKRYPQRMTEEEKFKEYYDAGLMFHMTHKQAQCFAGTALNFPIEDIMDILGKESNKNSYQAAFKEACRKSGIQAKHPNAKRQQVKELAEKLLEYADYEKVLAVGSPETCFEEKMEALNKLSEEKRILDIVKNNPNLLAIINEIDNSQLDKT